MKQGQNTPNRLAAACAVLLLLVFVAFSPAAEPAAPPATRNSVRHPNLLLNPSEIDEVKQKVQAEPWAGALLEKLKREAEGRGGSQDGIRNSALLYALTGEKHYADYARRRLLDDARSLLPKYEQVDLKTQPDFGMFSPWGLSAWGYDLVYDTCSPEERELIERYLRTGCNVIIEELKHTSTTPNLVFGVHFNVGMVGYCLGDAKFIDWALNDDGGKFGPHKGGFYPVLDSMIQDAYFWGEAPIYALHYDLHGMLSLAEAAQHYDGADLYHYVSKKSGGSIKGMIDGYLRLAYPTERTGVGMGSIRMATFGDGSTGYYPDGTLFDTFLVNPVSLAPAPGVMSGELELAYKRYKDPAYAWLISLNPKRDTYVDYGRAVLGYVALTHGQKLPTTPTPPAAPSGVYPGFGFAFLRADETPEYWRSGSLAALIMEGKLVGHGHKDYYSLSLHGTGRLIYPDLNVIQYEPTWLNWTHESIAHNTLVVDHQSGSPGPFTTKNEFQEAVKYFSISGSPYESEKQTRAVLLTPEYLADFFHAENVGKQPRSRTFDWALHGLGRLYVGNPSAYRPTSDLTPDYWWIDNQRTRQTDATFQADWIQRSAGVIPGRQAFGKEWFGQEVGVRMMMLGAPGTQVYAGDGPLCDGPPYSHIDGDPEGTCPMLVVRRQAPATTFAAVHEPYEGHPRIAGLRQLAGDDSAIAIRIAAPQYVDYLLAAFDDAEHTLDFAGGQSFTFTDYAYLRFRGGKLVLCGKVKGIRVKAPAADLDPKATINGMTTTVRISDGYVEWGDVAKPSAAKPPGAKPPAAAATSGPAEVSVEKPIAQDSEAARESAASLHAWFLPEEAHLTRGGKKEVQLHLRCVGAGQIKGSLHIETPDGIHTDHDRIQIDPTGEGEERIVNVVVQADKDASQTLRMIRLVPDEGISAAACELPVSVGVVITEERPRPLGAQYVVRAPGYTMKVDERSGVSFSLLDAQGRRRCGRIHNTNFIHGIPGVELEGKWLYDFSTPCSFIWPGNNALTIGCGQLYENYGLRLEYRFAEDHITIAVIAPTNPSKTPTMWLGTFEGIDPPKHNGKPDQRTDGPIVADRFFFPHPVYREGLLLTAPPQTPLNYRGTAVSFPLRRDQEITLRFVTEEEAGMK
jgi:hypothetical protein